MSLYAPAWARVRFADTSSVFFMAANLELFL